MRSKHPNLLSHQALAFQLSMNSSVLRIFEVQDLSLYFIAMCLLTVRSLCELILLTTGGNKRAEAATPVLSRGYEKRSRAFEDGEHAFCFYFYRL